MTKAIYFDMDGTIADLYGVEGWLDNLLNEHTKPYREARPLVNMRKLGRELNRLQAEGYVVGIVTWLSKNGTEAYNTKVIKTKVEWLKRHLGAVQFDEVHMVQYGTPKTEVVAHPDGVLFDDEVQNRTNWGKTGVAFNVENILEILGNMR